MKLWILNRPDEETGWDEVAAMVVRAKNETEARKIAGENAGDEKSDCWQYRALSTCKPLTAHGKAGLIVMDFNAG